MEVLKTQFKLFISKVTGNIAFLPSIIALGGVLFALLMIYAEERGVDQYLKEYASWLIIEDADTARTLLSTFIGGIISLMVFSFSMVMLLLNQASSSYSPRILPGLISNRKHQYVLGFYLAVLVYCIIILLNINAASKSLQIPGFAVLVGILLGINVLAAFIYFIHSISQAIQINNITDRIFTVASKRLNSLITKDDTIKNSTVFNDVSDWYSYKSTSSGHLNDIAFDALAQLAQTCDVKIKMLVAKGEFILADVPIVKVSNELDEDNQKRLQSCFGFSRSEIVKFNYVLGLKQLTEIALKAMSPGINDPGTAITCLDYLTELLAIRMKKQDKSYILSDSNEALVSLNTIDFDQLLYFIFASLRQYCKADFIMVSKMIRCLTYLKDIETVDDNYIEAIKTQAQLILADAKEFIKNKEDLKRITSLIKKSELCN